MQEGSTSSPKPEKVQGQNLKLPTQRAAGVQSLCSGITAAAAKQCNVFPNWCEFNPSCVRTRLPQLVGTDALCLCLPNASHGQLAASLSASLSLHLCGAAHCNCHTIMSLSFHLCGTVTVSQFPSLHFCGTITATNTFMSLVMSPPRHSHTVGHISCHCNFISVAQSHCRSHFMPLSCHLRGSIHTGTFRVTAFLRHSHTVTFHVPASLRHSPQPRHISSPG